MNYGLIICKYKLVDCIEMTEEYIKMIKEKYPEQYICGNFSVGRFAWILEDVEELENKIEAKCKLGIWKIDEELLFHLKLKQ